jgi:hypothetical protein
MGFTLTVALGVEFLNELQRLFKLFLPQKAGDNAHLDSPLVLLKLFGTPLGALQLVPLPFFFVPFTVKSHESHSSLSLLIWNASLNHRLSHPSFV